MRESFGSFSWHKKIPHHLHPQPHYVVFAILSTLFSLPVFLKENRLFATFNNREVNLQEERTLTKNALTLQSPPVYVLRVHSQKTPGGSNAQSMARYKPTVTSTHEQREKKKRHSLAPKPTLHFRGTQRATVIPSLTLFPFKLSIHAHTHTRQPITSGFASYLFIFLHLFLAPFVKKYKVFFFAVFFCCIYCNPIPPSQPSPGPCGGWHL